MLTVFTIGHSNRTWKAFLELLRALGIKRVVDVRSIPRSRHNPQFIVSRIGPITILWGRKVYNPRNTTRKGE